MKNFYLNNGKTYVDLNNLTMKECIFIQDKWEVIISFMYKRTMEKVNNFTYADTNTLRGKIDYIQDYLNLDEFDIIIG